MLKTEFKNQDHNEVLKKNRASGLGLGLGLGLEKLHFKTAFFKRLKGFNSERNVEIAILRFFGLHIYVDTWHIKKINQLDGLSNSLRCGVTLRALRVSLSL